MKKVLFVCLLAVVCISCRARNIRPDEVQPQMQPDYAVEADAQVQADEYVVEAEPVQEYAPAEVSPEDVERYRQNITVKAMGDDFIVYEYVDVRIDEIAILASHFCYETNPGKKAYLRDIYMQKNRKRRATFDCVDLAIE